MRPIRSYGNRCEKNSGRKKFYSSTRFKEETALPVTDIYITQVTPNTSWLHETRQTTGRGRLRAPLSNRCLKVLPPKRILVLALTAVAPVLEARGPLQRVAEFIESMVRQETRYYYYKQRCISTEKDNITNSLSYTHK